MRLYEVHYTTEEEVNGVFHIEADGYASASDACYYEHGDEPGYKEECVLYIG